MIILKNRNKGACSLAIILLTLILALSCTEREWENPFDENSDVQLDWNLQIEQLTPTTVKLTWVDVTDGENGFKIDRKVGEGSWEVAYATVGENITQYTDEGLTPEEDYTYRVYGYSGNVESDYAESSMNLAFPAPTNLQLTQLSPVEIKLEWNDNSIGEDGFKIDRKIGEGSWEVTYATVGEDITEYIDTDLTPEEDYTYRVYGYSGDVESDYAESSMSLAFPAPTNFQLSPLSITEIQLTWQDNSTGEDGFKIDRKVGEGSWEVVYATVGENFTEFIDTDVVELEEYTYRIRAYYQDYYSLYSDEVYYIIPPEGMAFVPGDTFQMGDLWGDGGSDETPVHTVTLSGFFISKYEVTNSEYCVFLNEEGNQEEGGVTWLDINDSDCRIYEQSGIFYPESGYEDHPVIEVSWYGARAYCEWKGGRLPTEAEWEYAARSGGMEQKYAGTSNVSELGDYAWYSANSGGDTHPVGTKLPNDLGIYDMSGNVWEWCNDWYDSDYYSISPENDPPGPESGTYRVLRGGSWSDNDRIARVANRLYNGPSNSNCIIGFRVVGGF
jgi:formylglycine-generating enzyme required for sulfatase activity/phosphoribosyl-ATP pyrophosphohydrolase